jgi:hypothetical protein
MLAFIARKRVSQIKAHVLTNFDFQQPSFWQELYVSLNKSSKEAYLVEKHVSRWN